MKTDPLTCSHARSLLDNGDIAYHVSKIARMHARLGDWFLTADYLGRVVDEMGRAWEDGEWTVVEEHVASKRLSLALSSVSASLPVPADAPLGLLATLAGERHTLGLSIAQMCLRSVGFETLWVGAEAPTDDLVLFIRDSRVALVALSASVYSTDHIALEAAYHDIASVCEDRGAMLLLGGRGKWPETLDYGYRCHSFEELRDILW